MRDLKLERMFETRSEEWERVGLAVEASDRQVKRAQRQSLLLLPLLIAVIVVYEDYRQELFTGRHPRLFHVDPTAVQVVTVVLLIVLGVGFAQAIGRAFGPTFLRRMDPGTAGTVGFLIRLSTVIVSVAFALRVGGVSTKTLAVGGAFTAVIVGLAAQQTLGNLFAGLVLLSARPFKVGVRVRLQAGALGGQLEGVVSSLGLMYTTLARGDDRVMIPNTQVLSAVVVPIIEPEKIDVKVRVPAGIRPSHAQAILDESTTTPTRSAPRVLLEEIDGQEVVLRIQAVPERAEQGAQLADEIIAALATVTDEHATMVEPDPRV
ncbi:MAG TPA: mechanosensitive ion channel family protein [Solirubrobacteraceae bacterium]|nr:mechanosensitive ion channel family protein [Solirubrobacteraceae bacterium]